jgi:hypothetical protein
VGRADCGAAIRRHSSNDAKQGIAKARQESLNQVPAPAFNQGAVNEDLSSMVDEELS